MNSKSGSHITVTQFRSLFPANGINLLVSGNVETGSNGEPTRLSNNGSIVGMTVAYKTAELAAALRQCESVGLWLTGGDVTRYVVGKVVGRQLSTEYMYLTIESCSINRDYVPPITDAIEDGKGDLIRYSSTGSSTIGLTPYIPVDFYFHDYNPNINNVTSSVYSDIARTIEDLGIITGSYLDSEIKYVRERGVENLMRGSAYPASIPNSFFTSLGTISGRSIGTKNEVSFFKTYYFDKQGRTRGVLDTLKDDLRRGTDSPFLFLQSFTGSFFVSGSQEDRIYEIDMNTGLSQIYYSKNPVYLPETSSITGSKEAIGKPLFAKEGTYVKRVGSVPEVGDTLYLIQSGSEHRLPEMKVYEPNTGRIHYTDDYGIIVNSVYVPRNVSENGYYSGSVSSYYLSLDVLKSTTEDLYECNGGWRYIVRISSDQVIPNMFFVTLQLDLKKGEEITSKIVTTETALVGDKTFEILHGIRDLEGEPVKFGIVDIVAGGEKFTGPFVCDGHIWSADWYNTWDIWNGKLIDTGSGKHYKEADCWDEYGHKREDEI